MSEQSTSAIEDIRVTELKILNSIVSGDCEALSLLLADDWIMNTYAGNVLSKEEYLSHLASGEFSLESLRHEDVVVRVFGDFAFTTGRSIDKHFGHEARQARFTNVWIRRRSRWQITLTQTTRVANPADK